MTSQPTEQEVKDFMQSAVNEAMAPSLPASPATTTPSLHIRTPSNSSFGTQTPCTATMQTAAEPEVMVPLSAVTKLLDHERKLSGPGPTVSSKQATSAALSNLKAALAYREVDITVKEAHLQATGGRS